MSASENKEFINKYIEALSGKPKTEPILRLYLDDQELIEHILASEAAFPEYEVIADEVLAEGDLVAVRARMIAIHKGPLMGVPPTEKRIEIPFSITYRIAKGKIADHWMNMDSNEMRRQLGIELVPQTAQAK